MKKIFILNAVELMIAVVMFYSCEKVQQNETEIPGSFCIPDSLMKNISFDTVRTENMTNELKLTGKITFNQDRVVKLFPFMGGRVTDVKVSPGDFVKKGQLIAIIRSPDMAGYASDYKSSEAELKIAKKNLDVTTELKASGVSSEKDITAAENDYQKALAQYNKMDEVMKLYGTSVSEEGNDETTYKVTSPVDGFIVEKNINSGMEIRSDDEQSMFTISDLKEVWVVANVFETDIAKIKEGSSVEVTTLSYPDRKFTGKIERVSNIINPETDVMTVRIRLGNDDLSLKPGMFANTSVLFPNSQTGHVIHSGSLLFDDNKNYVVLYRKRCDVKLLPVSVLKTFSNKSYIDGDSLQDGDLIVLENNLFVFTALRKL